MGSARQVPDEIRQILAEVCAEYRVRIDPDDPAVAIVMLNRLVLELALNRAVERIDAATSGLTGQVDAVQVRIGAVLAQELRSAIKGTVDVRPASLGFSINNLKVNAAVLVALAIGFIAGVVVR